MQDDISIAYRFTEIQPEHSPWPDHNSIDQPKPPKKWSHRGPRSEWRDWRGTEKQLTDDNVIAREPFSLAWCQRTQQYWVMRGDCTDADARGNPEIRDKWKTLFCDNRKDHGKPGLWQLSENGNTRQHDSRCPQGFEEFLPPNFFLGLNNSQACHFFGHLSLILGLQAMCPGDISHVPMQIESLFYRDNNPRYVSPRWRGLAAMDRFAHPGRAIVMQTGLIIDDMRSEEDEKRVEDWEQGKKGPMVSSTNPTEAEEMSWRTFNT